MLVALSRPRRSGASSYSTRWSWLSVRRPAASSAVTWTKASVPPPSGVMKPNPFASLKNFTVPWGIFGSFPVDGPTAGPPFRLEEARGRRRGGADRNPRHATGSKATIGVYGRFGKKPGGESGSASPIERLGLDLLDPVVLADGVGVAVVGMFGGAALLHLLIGFGHLRTGAEIVAEGDVAADAVIAVGVAMQVEAAQAGLRV